MSQNQNINLLDELVIHPVSAFNSKLIIQIVVGWILILILIYVLAINVQREKKKKIIELESVKKELLQEVEDYQEGLVGQQKEVAEGQLPVGVMYTKGFSRNLNDLAKYTPRGVWLKNVIITEPYNNVILEGSSVSPLGVSFLIKSLNKSESFRNKKFKELLMRKNIETKDLDFTISTFPPTSDESKGGGRKVDPVRSPRLKVQTEEEMKKIL